MRRIVHHLRPHSILELGCGLGAVGVRLCRMSAYTAVEPDSTSFAVASARIAPLGGTVICGDHRAVPMGSTYDLVCAFEVLEHIEDDRAALTQWLPLVRPGGHLLLSVPADPHRFGASDVLVGHYRRYAADELRQRLLDAGAVQARVTHYGWPLGYLLDAVRNRLAARRLGGAPPSPQERTHHSGRVLQPRGVAANLAIRVAVAPFVALQRLSPNVGPGLVALATRPG